MLSGSGSFRCTGIPDEQDIPAPETTIIRFDLTMAEDKDRRVFLVAELVDSASKLRVTVISTRREEDGLRQRTQTDCCFISRDALLAFC